MARNRYLSDGEINKMLQKEDNFEANDDEIDVEDFVQDPRYSPNEDNEDDDKFDIENGCTRRNPWHSSIEVARHQRCACIVYQTQSKYGRGLHIKKASSCCQCSLNFQCNFIHQI